MMKAAIIFVAVYGGCVILHLALNVLTNGRWSELMADLFPKGGPL